MTMIHSSILWKDWFGTETLRSIWSETNMVSQWMKVESALAQIQAEAGIIPEKAAQEIAVTEITDDVIADIRQITRKTRHVIAGFVKYMRERLESAGEFFHLGATTQDILETGLTLQIGESLHAIERDLLRLLKVMVDLSQKHQTTVMPGRSQGQQGLPVTFGFKTAIWGWELKDHMERLFELKKRLLVVSMSAAMGTQASFALLFGEKKAFSLSARVGEVLGLAAPAMDIHHRTDRYAELGNWLALLCSSLGEMGLELRDLQRTEVGEVAESWQADMVGSSTMVHKQNPEPSQWLEGLAKIVRGNALSLMDIQMQHERDATRTAALLSCLPESLLCTGAVLSSAGDYLQNLKVNEDRMLSNLEMTGGAMLSEAVWLKLFQKTGRRNWAQGLIKQVSVEAREKGVCFEDVLLEHADIKEHLTDAEIKQALTPEHYLGTVRGQTRNMIHTIREFIKHHER